MTSFSGEIPPHGCRLLRLSAIPFELGDLGAITPVNQNMYIGGSFNGWSLPTMPMTRVNEIWEYSNLHLDEGSYEMKFANSEGWSGKDWGDATGLSGIHSETTGGGSNISFTIYDAGAYNIVFDDNSLEYSIVADVANSVFLTEPLPTRVFPNPASDMLTFDLGNMNASRVSVFSPSGQELYNAENVCSKLTIDVRQFRSFGYILVKISDSTKEENHKVMLY
jgi:hypothetical protein